jgi:hypothetical protein
VNRSRFFSLPVLLELDPADIADVVRLSASGSSTGAWPWMIGVSSAKGEDEVDETESSGGGRGGAVFDR